MRYAAIIITGLVLAMALDGEFVAAPFWLAVAAALELKHRANAARPPRTAHPDAPTDRFPAVRKRGRHG